MRRWVWLLLLWSAPAFAGRVELDDDDLQSALGWTQDSRYFAWAGQKSWGYWDVSTASAKQFQDQSGKDKWLEAHPLAPKRTGRKGPNGAIAEVVITKNDRPGKWDEKKAEWTPEGYAGSELRVSRGGKSYISVDWFSSVDNVTPYWSEDGRRVVWELSEGGAMRPVLYDTLCFGTGGFPRVHVLGDPTLLKTRAPAVRTALDAQGFVTLYVGKSLKSRDATVVYAADGMEAEAAKAAKAIGGAKIEKLNWVVDADLVVALGADKGVK
ncbi:MAG: LytR C-terminal domain-containing protein [Myxococcaceae bacterium]